MDNYRKIILSKMIMTCVTIPSMKMQIYASTIFIQKISHRKRLI